MMTTPSLGRCVVCGKPTEPFIVRCDEHASISLFPGPIPSSVAAHAESLADKPLTAEQRAFVERHDAAERARVDEEERFKLWVMVCEPRRASGCGRSDSFIMAYHGEAFGEEMESVGTALASDYGLDDVPGPGIWVKEGRVSMRAVRVNCPLDPDEWDTELSYTGEWRRPVVHELLAAVHGRAPLTLLAQGVSASLPIEQMEADSERRDRFDPPDSP